MSVRHVTAAMEAVAVETRVALATRCYGTNDHALAHPIAGHARAYEYCCLHFLWNSAVHRAADTAFKGCHELLPSKVTCQRERLRRTDFGNLARTGRRICPESHVLDDDPSVRHAGIPLYVGRRVLTAAVPPLRERTAVHAPGNTRSIGVTRGLMHISSDSTKYGEGNGRQCRNITL
jgi:hypothetical protein